MTKLSVAAIKKLSEPGMYGDGGTLYLRVTPGGTKCWVQRVTILGKRCDIGLGGWPLVSLAEARETAFQNRRTIRSSGDPLAEKRKRHLKAPTFREAAEATFEANAPRIRTAKETRAWMAHLERHAFPILGNMRVDRIAREDVLRVLTPIWSTKPETARKLRQRIRATLKWAQAQGHIEVNAAGEAIDGALPTMPAVKAHLRALPYTEAADALATVEASRASLAAKLAFWFVVLTACRSGEVRGAAWNEINLQAKDWRIPANRTKSGLEHRVPLSDDAMAVLQRALPLRDDSDLIFPSPARRGRPLSDMALTKLLRDTGLAGRATVHGFRSTFRDWCAETGKPRELAEAALAHAVPGVEGAYFRSDLFVRRRQLMDDWARYLNDPSSTVLHLPR